MKVILADKTELTVTRVSEMYTKNNGESIDINVSPDADITLDGVIAAMTDNISTFTVERSNTDTITYTNYTTINAIVRDVSDESDYIRITLKKETVEE